MSKWIFRLTGLLVVALISLLFLDRWLNPEVPDYIRNGIDVRTPDSGRQPAQQEQAEQPSVPALTLTSLEETDGQTAQNQGGQPAVVPPASTQTTANKPAPPATVLEEAESVPVLSNPDSKLANVWLQAGSFSERANADKRAAVLKAHRWSVDIAPATVEGKTYYRVYVGPLTHDQVSGYMNKLEAMGISAREINR